RMALAVDLVEHLGVTAFALGGGREHPHRERGRHAEDGTGLRSHGPGMMRQSRRHCHEGDGMRANHGGGRRHRGGDGEDAGGPDRAFGRRGGGKTILTLLLVLVLVLFVTLNTQQVRIHFVFFSATVALIWALLGAAALGLVVGLLLGRPARRRRKREGRR